MGSDKTHLILSDKHKYFAFTAALGYLVGEEKKKYIESL